MSLWAPRDTQLRSSAPATVSVRVDGDGGRGFGGGHAVDADPTGADQLRRLLAGPRQTTSDQLGINASAPSHVCLPLD